VIHGVRVRLAVEAPNCLLNRRNLYWLWCVRIIRRRIQTWEWRLVSRVLFPRMRDQVSLGVSTVGEAHFRPEAGVSPDRSQRSGVIDA
jgi:hypothetical protein